MKICEDCPTDITDLPCNCKMCKPCANNRRLARGREQRNRNCKHCKTKLINPGRGVKYCATCRPIVKAMQYRDRQIELASQRGITLARGSTVAAKIARIVAADKSYCIDYGSPEI